MANPVLLSNEWHSDIKIITDRTAAYGDNLHVVPVLVTEMALLVLDFPICLIKEQETGQFQLHALLGFEPGENLYLDGDGWRSRYVPIHLRRQPFLLGFSSNSTDVADETAMVSINMESPRVNKQRGEALFNDDGSHTEFLQDIEKTLTDVLRGDEATKEFIRVLVELDLIEAVKIEVGSADGEMTAYDGIYTISDEKLAALQGDVLQQMNANGMLQICHLVIASLGHAGKLAEWSRSD